jgi:O-glycosyl hydrolase
MNRILKNIVIGSCLVFVVQMQNIIAQSVTIDLNAEYQSITGFGGMNMPGWINDLTIDQVDKAFGNAPGQLGLNMLRVRVPNDNTQFFREAPTAARAKSHGAIVFASPWSPPAALKSNNNIVGGYLLPENYGAFADHLLSFATYMQENDASLHAVSLQNEPDIQVSYESCDWTSQQMINFLEEQGSKVDTLNIIVAESYNFNRNMTNPILNDTEAEPYIGIIGGHIYGGGLYDYPLAREKGKEVWMTEHFTESGHSGDDWPLALDVATEINNCMKANFNAYVWWYIRRYYGPIDDAGNITKRGYIMSQFSKFIRPGTIRIDAVVASAPNVDATAYKTDSSFVLVVVNRNTTSRELEFTIQNGTVDTLTKYTTSATKNVENDGGFSVSGGTFNASVDASSITTFASYTGNAGRYGNTAPVAVAGPDIELIDEDNNGSEPIILDGSESYDPDGTIVNYSWSKDGMQIAWEAIYELDADVGEHYYVLTVTDNDGARHCDTVIVVVNTLNENNIWLEAECGQVGSNWNILNDPDASNEEYVMVQAGIQSLEEPSSDTADLIVFTFQIDEAGEYKLWGRANTPTYDDDSFWARMDSGTWARWNGIRSSGVDWHWDDVHSDLGDGEAIIYSLDPGVHTLTLCYREDGAGLDKFYITNTGTVPSGMGEPADNCPEDTIPDFHEIRYHEIETITIFPNPAQSEIQISCGFPFNTLTILSIEGRTMVHKEFGIPIRTAHVSLNLEAGLYVLVLRNESTYGMKKIIIE